MPDQARTKRVVVFLTDEELEVLDTVRIRAGFATPGALLQWLWHRELVNASHLEAIREVRG